jgi:BCCT family betaine/carnitine transporter
MSLWSDPVAQTGYPQDWTVFYLVYWFVFGPFTGLFVAKISKGRKIKEIILNMLVSGTAGLFLFFGIIGGYEQHLRIEGILDVPAMLTNGQSEEIAQSVINTLPFAKIAMVLYLIVIILFLATTLDSCSFTLASTVSKNLKGDEEPKKGLKFVWCIVLVAIPLAIAYVGTDINTIKSIVLATGLPLVIILAIIYWGFIREMIKDYGAKTKDQIVIEGRLLENSDIEAAVVDEENI